MKIETFKEKAENILMDLEYLVQKQMIQTGDTSEDCQRTKVINRLEYLRRAINGVEQADLIR